MTSPEHDPVWIPVATATAFCTVLALHGFEPRLSVTWSHAHLSREPWLPWVAAIVTLASPVIVRALWNHTSSRAELTPWSRQQVVGAWIVVLTGTLAVSFAFPAPTLGTDVKFLLDRMSDDAIVGRWHLLVTAYRLLVAGFADVAGPEDVIRCANAFMSSVALVAIAAAARELATTRREAVAMTVLSFTAFGTAQLVFGYSDVYPVALAIVALFCWLGLGAIAGSRGVAPAIAIAALGPFVYLGTLLLAPAVLVLSIVALRRPGGRREIAVAASIVIAIAGLSTLPGFGSPFALRAFLAASFDVPVVNLGYSAGGYQLPFERMFSAEHLYDVLHTMLLVDPVGWVLLLVPGVFVFAKAGRSPDRAKVAFLGSMLGSYLAFMIGMDSLYGAYLDWDLYSYGAIFTSLGGGYALMHFGRRSTWQGVVVGLAVATAGVHLMARLNAMDVDRDVHLLESEMHIFKRLEAR